MQHLNTENFQRIEDYINDYREATGGCPPTLAEIAEGLGLAKSTVSKYLKRMKEAGQVDFAGHRNIVTRRMREDAEGFCRVPLLGAVACGLPILAEENVEAYVRLPVALFGRGEYYLLRAKGDSMTGAGIEDGDLVLVRQQDTAAYNQIVVALIGEEATLKRFRPEREYIRLHAENPRYDDILLESCVLQGVAVKIIKDLK